MDTEIKKFLLNYVEDIEEDVYINFITAFSSFPETIIKETEMPIYNRCKIIVQRMKKKRAHQLSLLN